MGVLSALFLAAGIWLNLEGSGVLPRLAVARVVAGAPAAAGAKPRSEGPSAAGGTPMSANGAWGRVAKFDLHSEAGGLRDALSPAGLRAPAGAPHPGAIDPGAAPGLSRAAATAAAPLQPLSAQAGPHDGLTPQERAQAGGLGLSTPEGALRLGASYDLFAGMSKWIGRHPRLVSFVLNNDMVVRGFMDRESSRRSCSDLASLRSWLSDTRRPQGVGQSLPLLRGMLAGSPGTPAAVAGSKLVGRILECPAMQSLVNDPASVGQVATANPAIVETLADPALIAGISASPQALAAYSKLQLPPPAR